MKNKVQNLIIATLIIVVAFLLSLLRSGPTLDLSTVRGWDSVRKGHMVYLYIDDYELSKRAYTTDRVSVRKVE